MTKLQATSLSNVLCVAGRLAGSSVPEPATLALLGLGLVGLVFSRRRTLG